MAMSRRQQRAMFAKLRKGDFVTVTNPALCKVMKVTKIKVVRVGQPRIITLKVFANEEDIKPTGLKGTVEKN